MLERDMGWLGWANRHLPRDRNNATDFVKEETQHVPTLPNTGPGCARADVNHIAMPSPNKWLDSPEICHHPPPSQRRMRTRRGTQDEP